MTTPNERLREVLDQSIHKALLASEGAEHLQIKDVIRTVNSALEAIQAANLAVVDLSTHVVVERGSAARADLMLLMAAEYIREHWPDGIVHYDDADCDGFCVAEDCESALLTTKEPT